MPQLIVARAAHIAASILFAGIFNFDLVILGWRGRSESGDFHEIERRLFRLAIWTLLVAVFSALLWFSLEVASMSALPLKNVFSTMAWRRVLFETQFGRLWQLRLGVIAATFALIASGLPRVNHEGR
jgi:hypothetical protein